MKSFGYGLLGALSALLTLSLAGEAAFGVTSLIYGAGLQRIFADIPRSHVWSFVVGISIGFELLGSAHFGLWSLFCLIFWMLDLLFHKQLRFTSSSIRYLLSLVVLFVIYHFFFSAGSSLMTWLSLVLSYMILTLLLLLGQQTTEHPYGFE